MPLKVVIVGQGYVGLSISFAAASSGYQVVGYDSNPKLVAELKMGVTSIPGISQNTLKELVSKDKFLPTSDFSDAIGSEIIVLAVPTPLDLNRNPDLSFLIEAARTVARYCKNSLLVINESTSYPGTLRNIIKPIFDRESNYSHIFASAPERVDPGNSDWNIRNTPRVVGGLTELATSQAVNFYKSFCNEVFEVRTPEIAEASKIFENTFRQVNIGLVNELSDIAYSLGFSASEAINAASTKPFGYMPFYPSIGVGGHCIPVDPSYLSFIAKLQGVDSRFIELANLINDDRPRNVAQRIRVELGGDLNGKKIQVAGITYKPNVPDMRESPTPKLIQELRNLGAQVSWIDPLVKKFNNEESTPLSSNLDLGLLVVPHEALDLMLWRNLNVKVFDISPGPMTYGWPKLF